MEEAFSETELDELEDAERDALEDDEIAEEIKEQTETETETDTDTDNNNADSDDNSSVTEQDNEQDNEQDKQSEYVNTEATESKTQEDVLKQIDSDIMQLAEQVEEGDIDFKEYTLKLNELNNQRYEIKTAQAINAARVEQARADADKAWEMAANTFLSDESNKIFESNQYVQDALMRACREIEPQRVAEQKDYMWLLQQAKDKLAQSGAFSFSNSSTASNSNNVTNINNATKQKEVPITLGDVQSSSANSTNEFAHLDNLKGMEYEEAIANMSESQLDKYLKAG